MRRRTLEASACTAAWLENAVHTKGAIKNRAEKMIWPSEYRSMADAWELSGEEGRDKLRKAGVRSTYPFTPGCPNGVIRCIHASPEYLNI